MANIVSRRRSGFVLRGGRQRRETSWFFNGWTSTTIAAPGSVLIASLNVAALALRPFTIVRWRGLWSVVSDQIANGENQVVSYGVAVVSEQAVAIGVTAIPTPVTDLGSDLWFVLEHLVNRWEVVSAVGVESPIQTGGIDSKAMRKVEEGEDVVIVMETAAISAGAVMKQVGRFLVKLH